MWAEEDDEEEEVQGPLKIFSLHLVNSYGNAQLEPIDSTAGVSSSFSLLEILKYFLQMTPALV